MLVKQYTPFNDIRKGFDIVNAIINSVEDHKTEETAQNLVDFVPKINMRESENEYVIEVELPGVHKENVDIQIDANLLTVSGERAIKEDVQEEEYRKVESSYGKFSRAFTLPKRIDTSKIEARFELGMLEITVPKKELVDTSTKIEIQ